MRSRPPARQMNTLTQISQRLMFSADTCRCAHRQDCDCCRVLALCARLLPSNILADHRMHASGYQMLDQDVQDARDHHAWIRGEHESGKDQPGSVVIHAQSIHE